MLRSLYRFVFVLAGLFSAARGPNPSFANVCAVPQHPRMDRAPQEL